jgi:PilZ domain-containing protein
MQVRREVPRYIFEGQGKVIEASTGSASAVTFDDLSMRGCSIRGGALPPLGQPCELQIDWRGREIRLPATVAWKTKDGRAGLRFGAIPDDQLKLLRRLCASLHLLPPVPT